MEPEAYTPSAAASVALEDRVSFTSLADLLCYLDRPVSAEEIERRRQVVTEIFRLREEIGPVAMTLAKLLGGDDEE